MTMRRALIVLLLLLVLAASAFARVGGGDSYSGGGSSGGGGGGGDDGTAELIYLAFRLLLWLNIEYPAIGIPVDILVIILYFRWRKRQKEGDREVLLKISTVTDTPAAATLDSLRRFDPNFSEITFSDFCYSLYARAHEARGKRDLERYAPYLSPYARRTLMGQTDAMIEEVRGVIVGSFRVTSIAGLETPTVTVTVEYESNYTEVVGTQEHTWYARERWTLERQRDILSPPPERSKADHCPRCGGALQTRTDGACEYCGVRIESGAFQWFVQRIAVLSREGRGPLLTANVPERGTSSRTIYQGRFASVRDAFAAAHPGFTWQAFEERVRFIAGELQDAWSARDWEKARPLETENLFQMHRYWIDAYLRQKLRNVVDDFAVRRVEPVKIEEDAFYEAITVRVFANGRDYTVDEQGSVVAGSKQNVREWSEYWTLIRTKSAGDSPARCPNCGAEVRVGATGICQFCGGKISAGHFDWILSKIQQDESYV
jgi:predicted lipid-binding transport protein (Tim44 family)